MNFSEAYNMLKEKGGSIRRVEWEKQSLVMEDNKLKRKNRWDLTYCITHFKQTNDFFIKGSDLSKEDWLWEDIS